MLSTQDQNRPIKEQLYALFAQLTRALANPHRLELIDLLVQAPRTVEELANEAHMSVANTSQHLQRLKQVRLVESEREGLYVRYRLADPSVADLWLQLRAVAERQIAEVQQTLDAYRNRRHEFEVVPAADLVQRLRDGTAVLLDVRPAVEYQSGHLPDAISLPIDEIEQRVADFQNDANLTVIAYCRGPYCVYADDALGLLAARGHAVARLEEGVAEWGQAGYDLQQS